MTNIGVHLFDLLLYLFGPLRRCEVHQRNPSRAAGFLELERAHVRWLLSTDAADLPFAAVPGSRTSWRALTVDGEALEFSDGFSDLHSRVYERVLAGEGFRIPDVRPAIELTHRIRHARIMRPTEMHHPNLVIA